MGVAFLKFFDLFGGKDFAVIHFNGGILPDPFAEGGLGDAVFLAELGLSFPVLMEGNERLFKILILFVVVVCCHSFSPFLVSNEL